MMRLCLLSAVGAIIALDLFFNLAGESAYYYMTGFNLWQTLVFGALVIAIIVLALRKE